MIENHTNWSLSRLLKVRAPLAYRSVLSEVALVQLPLVHHDADKSTVLVDYAKQCPLSQQYCVCLWGYYLNGVSKVLEMRSRQTLGRRSSFNRHQRNTVGSCFLVAVPPRSRGYRSTR